MTETVIFRCSITDPEYGRRYAELFDLTPVSMVPGDRLDLTYTFHAQYLGRIAERFQALIDLMERGHVINVDMQEARNQTILFKRLVELYTRIVDNANGCEETLPFAEPLPDDGEAGITFS